MKEKMLEKLISQFPGTIDQFQKWFVHRYNIDLLVFENAPFEDRCKEILRFLGLSLNLNTSTGKSSVIDQIKHELQVYEDLLTKIPVKPIDPLKSLSILPYSLRTKDTAMIFEHNTSTRSIRNALVMMNTPMESLRDSLKELPGRKVILSNDTFWEDIRKEDRIHKAVPF